MRYHVHNVDSDLIGDLLKRDLVKGTRNRRACMVRVTSVDEVEIIMCQDKSVRHSLLGWGSD